MKIPKIKELANWVLVGAKEKTVLTNYPKTLFSNIGYYTNCAYNDTRYTEYTACFKTSCSFVQQDKEYVDGFKVVNIPQALQDAIMREIYGEIVEELTYIIPEAEYADMLQHTNIASRLKAIINAIS